MRRSITLLIATLGLVLTMISACGGDTTGGEAGNGGGGGGGAGGGAPTSASASVSTNASAQEKKVLQDANAVKDLLNEFWTQELQARYGLQFDAPNDYEYYRGASNDTCAGQNARALPQNAYYCAEDTDEYVAFDLDWFTSYLDAYPGGATTFLILAHEWGHAVQDTWVEQQPGTDVWDPPYLKELQADCLAGVWMEDALRRGTIIEEPGDADAIFESLWEMGSGPWFAPGDHGTKEQRVLAFSTGFKNGTDYCRTNLSASSNPTSPPSASPSTSATPAPSAEEEAAIDAANNYYGYAEVGDYDTTYDLLSQEYQNYYTREEWISANTVLDSAAAVFDVTGAYPDDLGLGVPTYAVTLTVYADGSSFDRTTYFVYEDSHWTHYLSTEEVNSFDDALY
jgi:uncharacterized protein